MRIPILLLLAAALAFAGGCASKKGAAYNQRKSGRDYSSVNKTSVKFLFKTFLVDRDLRRQGQKRMWDKGEKRRENATVKRESIAFLWDALKAGESDSWKYAWTEQFPEMLKGPEDFGASVRFGFLDTGD